MVGKMLGIVRLFQEDFAPRRPALLRRVAVDRAGKLGLDEEQ